MAENHGEDDPVFVMNNAPAAVCPRKRKVSNVLFLIQQRADGTERRHVHPTNVKNLSQITIRIVVRYVDGALTGHHLEVSTILVTVQKYFKIPEYPLLAIFFFLMKTSFLKYKQEASLNECSSR